MQLLETVAPPLALAWMSTAWMAGEVDRETMLAAAQGLEALVCLHPASSVFYVYDAIVVAARTRVKWRPAGMRQLAVPASHTTAGAACLDELAVAIVEKTFHRPTVSLYMHALNVPRAALIETQLITAEANVGRTAFTINRFANDCKFKKHGDMFLWILIKLRLAAWETTSLAKDETPWAIFAASFTDEANMVARPLVNSNTRDLLTTLETNIDLFAVLASLALELTDGDGKVAVNGEIVRIGPAAAPTLCVVRDFAIGDKDNACGYMADNIFYWNNDPIQAICAWAHASAARDERFAHFAELCSDSPLSPDNPLLKFAA
jgi:hypothetical protein